MGLLIIEVPEGRISCIERSINLAEWEVKPVSMTVMKEVSDAMNRWHILLIKTADVQRNDLCRGGFWKWQGRAVGRYVLIL